MLPITLFLFLFFLVNCNAGYVIVSSFDFLTLTLSNTDFNANLAAFLQRVKHRAGVPNPTASDGTIKLFRSGSVALSDVVDSELPSTELSATTSVQIAS
jgi:hypothetical protein